MFYQDAKSFDHFCDISVLINGLATMCAVHTEISAERSSQGLKNNYVRLYVQYRPLCAVDTQISGEHSSSA